MAKTSTAKVADHVEKELATQQDLPLEGGTATEKPPEENKLPAVQSATQAPAGLMDDFNPFEEAGRAGRQRIIGELLKFSKGDWLFGKDSEELPLGTKMIANLDQLLRGWIRWEDNKPAEQIMGFVIEGHKIQPRSSLGYTDDSEWEVEELTGKPKDPWQETYYMAMRQLDKDGKPMDGEDGLFTFTTSSVGGKDTMVELCGIVGKWMRVHSTRENGKIVMKNYPVVTLGKRQYPHPIKSIGIVKVPTLKFNPKTDWIAKEKFGEIVDAAPDASEGEDIPF